MQHRKSKTSFAKLKKLPTTALLLVVSAFVTACSSQPLKVESDPPGADVFVSVQGQSKRKVGQTPYVLQPADQGEKSSSVQVIVAKEGYVEEAVLFPPAALGRAGQVFVKLNEVKLPPQCSAGDDSMERLARGVAEIQSLIKGKNLDQAESSLSTLITQFPTIAVLHDLRGNTHYLRRNYEKALESYKKSLDLSPGNPGTARMVKRLEELRGGTR